MQNKYYDKDDRILISNVLDKYNSYVKTGKSNYTNFLNNRELNIVTRYLEYQKIPYFIYEPYSFLEKKIIVFGEYDNYVTFYKVDISTDIGHSNILGTLFSLGLNDDLIGDIFVEDGYFYYTNLTRMNKFLEENLVIIKNKLVKLEKVNDIVLEKCHLETQSIMVNSMRIDNILSKITSKSRSQVNSMLLDKLVLLNYKEVNSNSIILKENDILSIRKYGKYRIGKQIGKTKKDNIILEIYKYV